MKIEKYLGEGYDDLRSALKGLDEYTFTNLKDSYWGVSDNIGNLVKSLKNASKQEPYLKQELKIAQQLEKIFRKMTLGESI